MPPLSHSFMNWQTLQTNLAVEGYIASAELAMAVHIALNLERPIFLGGEAGVGSVGYRFYTPFPFPSWPSWPTIRRTDERVCQFLLPAHRR